MVTLEDSNRTLAGLIHLYSIVDRQEFFTHKAYLQTHLGNYLDSEDPEHIKKAYESSKDMSDYYRDVNIPEFSDPGYTILHQFRKTTLDIESTLEELTKEENPIDHEKFSTLESQKEELENISTIFFRQLEVYKKLLQILTPEGEPQTKTYAE